MCKGSVSQCMEPSTRKPKACRLGHEALGQCFITFIFVVSVEFLKTTISLASLLTFSFTLNFVLGDLLYIDVLTLEDAQVNVTASTCGFFVNRLVFNLGIHEQPISLLLTALVLFVLFEDITCYCALFGSHANIQIISGGIVVVINIICNMQTKLNLLPISQKNVNLTIANKNLSPICN